MSSDKRLPLSAKAQLLRVVGTLDGMSQVERLIEKKLVSEAPLLQEISTYLFSLGGKRMRPVLALMSGKALGLPKASDELVQVSAGIELIHMATLLHDDIIDKSPLRRHKESPFIKYGIDTTLLTGDFLLTRAFSLCSHLDEFIVNATESACIELTEGEILEVPLHHKQHTINEYLTIARKKTASLFRLAALSGAHLASTSDECSYAMGRFGENLGIAFQILDDVLDVVAEENLLGKRSGMDIRERKPSIVNLLWLASGDPEAKPLLLDPGSDDEKFAERAVTLLRKSPVIEEASALARTYASAAEKELIAAAELCTTVNQDTFQGLKSLIYYTLERVG